MTTGQSKQTEEMCFICKEIEVFMDGLQKINVAGCELVDCSKCGECFHTTCLSNELKTYFEQNNQDAFKCYNDKCKCLIPFDDYTFLAYSIYSTLNEGDVNKLREMLKKLNPGYAAAEQNELIEYINYVDY